MQCNSTRNDDLCNKNQLEKEICEAIDALNFFLVALGVPYQLRAFIDAVYGASSESPSEWFDLSDAKLAARALPEKYADGSRESAKKNKQAAEKWTQRWRKELVKFQHQRALSLIDCKIGFGFKTESGYQGQDSRYRNLIWDMPAKIMQMARSSSNWAANPDMAKRVAAKKLGAEFPRKPVALPPPPQISLDGILRRDRQTILTKAKKDVERMRRAGRDASLFIRELIDDLETLLNLNLIAPAENASISLSSSSSCIRKDHSSEEESSSISGQVYPLIEEKKSQQRNADLADIPADIEAEERKREPSRGNNKHLPHLGLQLVDEAFADRLQGMSVYAHLEVRKVYEKFKLHCELKGVEPTRSYFANYLKIEKPPSLPKQRRHPSTNLALVGEHVAMTEDEHLKHQAKAQMEIQREEQQKAAAISRLESLSESGYQSLRAEAEAMLLERMPDAKARMQNDAYEVTVRARMIGMLMEPIKEVA